MSDLWNGQDSHSVICIGNVIETYSSSTISADIEFLSDFLTTTFYVFSTTAATLTGTFSAQECDFIAVGPSNFDEAQLTISAQILVGTGWVTVGEVSYTDGLKDNSPGVFTFDKQSITSVRIVITGAGGIERRISLLTAGLRVDMPCLPDVGFTPGFLNTLDEITDPTTEGNAFGPSRVLPRGTEEIAPFSDLSFVFFRQEWPRLLSWRGYPIYFVQNAEEYPSESIFGRWTFTPLSYSSVNAGGVTLTVTGNA